MQWRKNREAAGGDGGGCLNLDGHCRGAPARLPLLMLLPVVLKDTVAREVGDHEFCQSPHQGVEFLCNQNN
jgi:hypothetical protein